MENKDLNIKLVRQLHDGSDEAFTQLYMLYAGHLYNFILKLTKSSIEAEDILQETFLRIWHNRQRINPDTSFKSYLFTISYHLIIDSLRKQIDSVEFESFLFSEKYRASTDNTIEQQLTIEDYKKIITSTLAKLTPRQQNIYHLSREKELSAKEIGQKLGISEKTVNNQLSIILAALKAELLLYMFIYVL